MTDPEIATEAGASAEKKKAEIHSLKDVLRSLIGKVATVSNPESMEAIPLGYQIKPGFYRAKVLSVYDDMVAVVTELSKGAKSDKTPAKQFIPFHNIKRVCLTKDEIHLHL